MTSSPWLQWALLVACAAPVLLGIVALVFRQPLDVEAFVDAMTRLIRSGNEQRARKLAKAASQVLIGKVAAAVLAADVPLLDPERTARGYREQSAQRPYRERLLEAVAPVVGDARRRVVRAGLLTLPGWIPVPLLWLLGVRWSVGDGTKLLVAAAVLLLLALGGLAKWRSNLRGITRTVEGLAGVLQERLELLQRNGSSH